MIQHSFSAAHALVDTKLDIFTFRCAFLLCRSKQDG